MNERGFFTLTGLCILLVVVLFVRSAAESETNYSYEVADFQTEYELQNIADGALVEAIEKVRAGDVILKENEGVPNKDRQYLIAVTAQKKSSRLGNVTVKVWGEYGKIYTATRKYKSGGKIEDVYEKDDKGRMTERKGKIFMSVAQCDYDRMGGKIYRRSLAYVEDDDEDTIHFLKDELK